MYPFTIRLVDRLREECGLQSVRCKLDPGSKTTGIAIVREMGKEQTVISLIELHHRGSSIQEKFLLRRGYRRRRRGFLRYRSPRFSNRTKKKGWLPPSLQHRVDTVYFLVNKLQKMIPLKNLTCETVRFDMQKLQDPKLQGIEHQQGTLFGYEIREYLLEKWGRKCTYCDKQNIALQIDHVVPKSCGGTDRVSNLTLACSDCNVRKGNLPVEEFAPKKAPIIATKPSLRDSSAVNSTRNKLKKELSTLLPCKWATGGQTKYNRSRLHIPKTHALDAACTGEVTKVLHWNIPIQVISCMGRGSYQRTRPDRYGFPRGILSRKKQVDGFQTGDHVKAMIPKGTKAGIYMGRIAVRSSGFFNLQTGKSTIQGISRKHCQLIQRGNGYRYEGCYAIASTELTNKRSTLPSPSKGRGIRVSV
jgi:5-methylcytosine-specific restriction endonuclease McrA